MNLLKLKLIAKKSWLWAKKFWWVIVIALLFICAALIGALTRNGAFLATAKYQIENLYKQLNLYKLRSKVEISNKEDRKIEAELKRLVDKSYNDPEKLAKELAEAFGLNNA